MSIEITATPLPSSRYQQSLYQRDMDKAIEQSLKDKPSTQPFVRTYPLHCHIVHHQPSVYYSETTQPRSRPTVVKLDFDKIARLAKKLRDSGQLDFNKIR